MEDFKTNYVSIKMPTNRFNALIKFLHNVALTAHMKDDKKLYVGPYAPSQQEAQAVMDILDEMSTTKDY